MLFLRAVQRGFFKVALKKTILISLALRVAPINSTVKNILYRLELSSLKLLPSLQIAENSLFWSQANDLQGNYELSPLLNYTYVDLGTSYNNGNSFKFDSVIEPIASNSNETNRETIELPFIPKIERPSNALALMKHKPSIEPENSKKMMGISHLSKEMQIVSKFPQKINSTKKMDSLGVYFTTSNIVLGVCCAYILVIGVNTLNKKLLRYVQINPKAINEAYGAICEVVSGISHSNNNVGNYDTGLTGAVSEEIIQTLYSINEKIETNIDTLRLVSKGREVADVLKLDSIQSQMRESNLKIIRMLEDHHQRQELFEDKILEKFKELEKIVLQSCTRIIRSSHELNYAVATKCGSNTA
ncbi:hypothetical protein DASC09_032130 [Saccharomycopsis crataegensis]|uniref:Uncharacterized protein n=1 Tax=Saccharomycopsis crataegensis TaxID=43959 RepID=A0AAV5QM77_9ASCO|nr:hypothetical protein DASC09_032130 [Saccharomycopsis crataegensis]